MRSSSTDKKNSIPWKNLSGAAFNKTIFANNNTKVIYKSYQERTPQTKRTDLEILPKYYIKRKNSINGLTGLPQKVVDTYPSDIHS